MTGAYAAYSREQLLAILAARDDEVLDLQRATEALVAQLAATEGIVGSLKTDHAAALSRQRLELAAAFERELSSAHNKKGADSAAALAASLHAERMGRAAEQSRLRQAEAALAATEDRCAALAVSLSAKEAELRAAVAASVGAGAGSIASSHYLYLGLDVEEVGGDDADGDGEGGGEATKKAGPSSSASSPEAVSSPFLVVRGVEAPAARASSPTAARLPHHTFGGGGVAAGDRLVAATVTKTYVFDEVLFGKASEARAALSVEAVGSVGGGGDGIAGGAAGGSVGSRAAVAAADSVPLATSAQSANHYDPRAAKSYSVADSTSRADVMPRYGGDGDDERFEGYPSGIGMSRDRAPSPSPAGGATTSAAGQHSTVVDTSAPQRELDVIVTLHQSSSSPHAKPASPLSATSTQHQHQQQAHQHFAPLAAYEQLVNELPLYGHVALTIARPLVGETKGRGKAASGVDEGADGTSMLVRTLRPFFPMVAAY